MTKKRIDKFGKTFEYLKDPETREREMGQSLLTVDGAIFQGIPFEDMDWKNIVFKNCDFFGNYDIGPNTQNNVRYEDCRFSGILSFGKTHNVRFLRCAWVGAPVMFAEKGSTDTVFESCTFAGKSPNPNQQGGVGSHGDAEFIDCYAKWFSLVGDASLTLRKCECEGASIETDSEANSGDDFLSSKVVIQQSKLRGYFDMRATSLHSLSIQDTVIERFDISRSTVKQSVVIERVKGGYLNMYPQHADSLAVRNSQLYGNDNKIFSAYAGSFRTIEIDNVTFGGGTNYPPVVVAGGFSKISESRISHVSENIRIKNSRIPYLASDYLNTPFFQIVNCEIDDLDLSNGRVENLEIQGNLIRRGVNFSNTQVKQSRIQPLTKAQVKLDGSNIRLN
ncbi:hypothetical protein [Pseudacidovorax intermedius]|uniref:hypothetical protein n=1 Tax=Pseudacidovorax intermedius TaxID=433924 RepID=UPI0026EA3AA5|nr:hypothetical protein [Pseudacidovorax intermedius]